MTPSNSSEKDREESRAEIVKHWLEQRSIPATEVDDFFGETAFAGMGTGAFFAGMQGADMRSIEVGEPVSSSWQVIDILTDHRRLGRGRQLLIFRKSEGEDIDETIYQLVDDVFCVVPEAD